MKKKITLFLTLILSLVTIFSMTVVGAYAEEPTWSVKVNDYAVVKGTQEVNISYTLKYGEDEVTAISSAAPNGVEYMSKPYVVIMQGETVIAQGTTTIKTKDMSVGDVQLVIKVFDKKDGLQLGSDTIFKLTIQKKDNTMTIIMIVLIVLIVGYMIYSSFANKKKQKKAQEQVSELKVGDRVMTIGGVCGFVKEINNKENTFILEVGEKSYVKFDKRAISEKHSKDEAKAEVKEEKVDAPVEDKKEEK